MIKQIANRYMNKSDHRGFWFRDRARSRRMTIDVTRGADGSYYIHGAKAHYNEGGVDRSITVNPRELKKEIRKAVNTSNMFTTH